MYYQTKFRWTQETDEGKTKRKTAALLIETETFADAEAETFWYCEQQGLNDCEVIAVNRSPIREVANPYHYALGMQAWTVTLEDMFVTPEGKEKRLKYPVIFWTNAMPSANDDYVQDYLKGIDPNSNTMTIVSVKKSDIIAELQ